MGALFGAVITGMITLTIFKLEQRKETNKVVAYHKKRYKEIEVNLECAIVNSLELQSIIENGSPYMENQLSRIVNGLIVTQEKIKYISVNDIPDEIHDKFLELKSALDGIRIIGNVYDKIEIHPEMLKGFSRDVSTLIENKKIINNHFK